MMHSHTHYAATAQVLVSGCWERLSCSADKRASTHTPHTHICVAGTADSCVDVLRESVL